MATGHPERRLATSTSVVRRRALPFPAEVLVAEGDVVRSETPVARTRVEGQLLTLDVTRALGVGTAQLGPHLLVRSGQQVDVGQPLARREGFLRGMEVRAPAGGTVVAIQDGRLYLREPHRQVLVRAHLPGRVIAVIPDRGADVCCAGVLVSGLWGVGGEACGPLAVRSERAEAPLAWQHVGRDDRGVIVAGGPVVDRRVLLRARQFGLAGLLVASLHPDLEPLSAGLELPIVAVEGLGRFALTEPLDGALRSRQGAMAALCGTNADARYGPELVAPLTPPETGAPPPTDATVPQVRVGDLVRLTRSPYAGQLGRVIDLDPSEPSAEAYVPEVVEVRFADGQRLILPLCNLEIVG